MAKKFYEPAWAKASPQATDLYKVYTYRDALEVRAAVALYPGDRPCSTTATGEPAGAVRT